MEIMNSLEKGVATEGKGGGEGVEGGGREVFIGQIAVPLGIFFYL